MFEVTKFGQREISESEHSQIVTFTNILTNNYSSSISKCSQPFYVQEWNDK